VDSVIIDHRWQSSLTVIDSSSRSLRPAALWFCPIRRRRAALDRHRHIEAVLTSKLAGHYLHTNNRRQDANERKHYTFCRYPC